MRWILSAAAICGSATPKKLSAASWQKRCARCSAGAGCLPDARRRAEIPFGGKELQTIYLAQLLYLLARRRQRTRKQSPRARAEQEQAALVESVRLYFAQNIEKPLALDQVCDANGCSRVALQQAFRARTRMGPMEYFSCMKAEQAALLLTQGYGPGETARMLGYGSLAWFSRRFHALTGQTPGAYRRAPHPLHLCER